MSQYSPPKQLSQSNYRTPRSSEAMLRFADPALSLVVGRLHNILSKYSNSDFDVDLEFIEETASIASCNCTIC